MESIDKKLIPTTIIPSSMYVERSADKQIKNIIRDMGRPAYILVARQMGKTNLLINAIRNLKGSNDVFGFVDLSNRFETDRECFRNIIDKVLDSNFDELESIAESIACKREGRQIVPHREHLRELREILSGITGKLIINLDEIDSLTVADYSDKIFAQIRSVYFDRINYPEFERLSYILSGVAEPSDIIKDKSISPFNIGQKILLGDFTYEEFLSLVEKANLTEALDQEVKQRIFYWTNGNPRLSWEILSEVEDKVLNQESVESSTVDKIVNESYLANYDKPPVDHIRSLVESSAELREAVISIYYGKPETIDNDLKNRLYLAGVLGSDYEYGDIRIKNRIVEDSLDLNWLIELNKSKNVSLIKANEHFDNSEFIKAKDIYDNIVENQDFSEAERLTANYKLGACYFSLGEDLKTVRCYENKLFDKNGYQEVYSEQIYILAVAHSRLKNNQEAQELFDELIQEPNNEFYYLSLVGKAKILESLDRYGNKDEIFKLNMAVVESENTESNNALSGAYYNLGGLTSVDDKKESYKYFIKAFEHADAVHQVKPLVHALKLDTSEFESLFNKIIATFQSSQIQFDNEKEPYGLEVNTSELSDLVSICRILKDLDKIDLLIDTIKDYCLVEKATLANLLFQMAGSKLQESETNDAKFILNKIIVLEKKYTSAIPLFMANKYLSYIDLDNKVALEHYFSRVQNYTEQIDHIDVTIFEKKIIALINEEYLDKAEKYCDMIVKIEGLRSHKSRVRLLTILFLKMRCIKDIEEKKIQAAELKETIGNIEQGDLQLTTINEDTFKTLTEEIDAALLAVIPVRQYVREGFRYGRNDVVKVRYQDGREENKKYKHVLDSISKGLCELIV